MSSRHVEELRRVVECLLRDAATAFPELTGEFCKDLSRLLRLIEDRGLPLLVVDLPRAGKHLDRCLSSGQYTQSGLPLTKRVSSEVVIPKLFRGLYLLVFEKDGRLKDHPSIEAILFLRQLCYVGKKAKVQCDDDKVTTAVDDFVQTDLLLPEPETVWDQELTTARDFDVYEGFAANKRYQNRIDALVRDPVVKQYLKVFLGKLDHVAGLLTTTLGTYRPEQWSFRHGPGAIAERTGPVNKYSWINWPDRLDSVFPIADCGYHSASSWAENCNLTEIASEEPASRLIAVPKTFSGPRLIAAEPAAHQWCQQNLWHYFCVRTSNSWIGNYIRFRDQLLNQSLCLEGSRTGQLVTVDLSSASDRLTPCFVGNLFRGNPTLLRALQASRTRYVTQDLCKSRPERIQLRKFSTMGSACTFPLQSLGFLAIALACNLTVTGCRASVDVLKEDKAEIAVFGDDIIVSKDCWGLLQVALEVLDFKVNNDKTFSEGNFRESCGVDAFRGIEVTPVYWQAPCEVAPGSVASTAAVRNNFYQKFFLHTASYLASTIPWDLPTVSMDSGIMGLKSFTPPTSARKTRWNTDLQLTEAFVPTLFAKVRKSPTNDDTALFQFFTENPDPMSPWEHGVAQRPSVKIRKKWVPEHLLGFPT